MCLCKSLRDWTEVSLVSAALAVGLDLQNTMCYFVCSELSSLKEACSLE